MYNIIDYGASTSSKDNSLAILKTFQIANNSNSTVLIPQGTFSTNILNIQNINNITFQIDGTLQALPKKSIKWNGTKDQGLINFDNCNHFRITGTGIIDGNGQDWWPADDDRPSLIRLSNLEDFELSNLTIQNSPEYHIRIFDCKNLKIHDAKINSQKDSPTTDGINIEQGGQDVEIYNMNITSGDDGIAINAFKTDTENIYVHDCVFQDGHGVSIGSGTYQTISNVRFENLIINNSQFGIRIKCKVPPSSYKGKQKVENISFKNIVMNNIEDNPIQINTEYSGNNDKVRLNGISFKDIECKKSGYMASFRLVSKKNMEDRISLENIVLTEIENKKKSSKLNKVENVKFATEGKIIGVPGIN